MRSFTYSIHIDRTPEAVWNFILDFSKAARWRNLVRTLEILTPGTLRAGSELKVTHDAMGRSTAPSPRSGPSSRGAVSGRATPKRT